MLRRDLHQAVLEFTRRYNNQWLIERVGAGNPITADEQGKRDTPKELTWRPDLRGAGETACSSGRVVDLWGGTY